MSDEMPEERQCYYIVRADGSVSCYLKDEYVHRVLADTMDVEALRAQLAERDALIAQFRADIANRDEKLARLNSVFSVMKYGVAQ